jgi:hypothetical protein
MMFLVRSQLFVVRSSLLVLVFAFGCQKPDTAEKPSPLQQVEQLIAQKTELQSNLEKSQIENDRLKKQIDTLSNLPGEKKAESLYQLQAVKIGRYTNLYDEDKNWTKEKLIVYVQPVDEVGDIIKAAGAVDVQLWDLNKKESESLVAQWRIEPNELKKLWLNSMFSGNYRLTFDLPALEEKADRALTIKVAFTDYLSGRTFTDQFILRPDRIGTTENEKAIKP